MVWPTLGSTTAIEQNRTEREHDSAYVYALQSPAGECAPAEVVHQPSYRSHCQ